MSNSASPPAKPGVYLTAIRMQIHQNLIIIDVKGWSILTEFDIYE
jgi:hypothetical protein